MKVLLIVLSILLAACRSVPPAPAPVAPVVVAPKVVEPEEPTEPAAVSPEVLSEDSLRFRIVAAATAEWVYFGRQQIVIEGNEESIPRVGIWEDEEVSHSDRINQYWRAVGKNRLSGYDCREPWSAAFISWVMQAAGVPRSLFPPSGAHRFYLNRFLGNARDPEAALLPHAIEDYKPRPGDLICAIRGRFKPTEAIQDLPDTLNGSLHCDIVVETDGRTLQAIGGNVRNSVSKTVLTLAPDGYLQFSNIRPWVLVIENRLD
jgi:hypothetical protein